MIDRFENFVGKISAIHKNIEKIKKNRMKEFGLSGNHVMSLLYLEQYPDGLTATRLCDLISVDKAAISRTLSELVEKGYVSYRDLDTHKKYRAIAVLTKKGQDVTKKISEIIYDVVGEIGSGLTEEERIVMYRSLDVISNKIENVANVFVAKERI